MSNLSDSNRTIGAPRNDRRDAHTCVRDKAVVLQFARMRRAKKIW
jgi:hypothetical protein